MNQEAYNQGLLGSVIALNFMMSSLLMFRSLFTITHGDLAFGDLAGLSSITLVVAAGLLALTAGILILTRRNYRKHVKHIVTLLVIQLICLFVISVSVLDMWVFVGTASLVFLVLATLVQVLRFMH